MTLPSGPLFLHRPTMIHYNMIGYKKWEFSAQVVDVAYTWGRLHTSQSPLQLTTLPYESCVLPLRKIEKARSSGIREIYDNELNPRRSVWFGGSSSMWYPSWNEVYAEVPCPANKQMAPIIACLSKKLSVRCYKGAPNVHRTRTYASTRRSPEAAGQNPCDRGRAPPSSRCADPGYSIPENV